MVGTIVELEKSGGTFRRIRVKPAVDFSALEQVLVVLGSPTFVGPQPPGRPDGPAEPPPAARRP